MDLQKSFTIDSELSGFYPVKVRTKNHLNLGSVFNHCEWDYCSQLNSSKGQPASLQYWVTVKKKKLKKNRNVFFFPLSEVS